MLSKYSKRRSCVRPLEQVNAVLSSLVSCIQVEPSWISLAPPQCPRWPVRCWWAYQQWRLGLGRLIGAVAPLLCHILHGPQGTQGGDLGLGQSSDTRDSEPLVGSVAA